jgi:hypothetical protein
MCYGAKSFTKTSLKNCCFSYKYIFKGFLGFDCCAKQALPLTNPLKYSRFRFEQVQIHFVFEFAALFLRSRRIHTVSFCVLSNYAHFHFATQRMSAVKYVQMFT